MSVRPITLIALAVAALASAGAHAQSSWNLVSTGNTGGQCTQQAANTGNFDNSYNCNNGSGTVGVSAWSTSRGTQAGTSYSGGNGAGTTYANSFLSNQGTSGFGNSNRNEGLNPPAPDHSFDSGGGVIDMMLLDFGSSNVVLNQVGIGWKNGTGMGDMTVMRWVGSKTSAIGSAAPGANGGGSDTLAAQTCTGGIVTACWQLVGSYADLGVDNSNPYGGAARNTGATGSMASSWWMLATFNTALNGGSTNCKNGAGATVACSASNDAFKINFIQATASQVPVPGSLALAGLALGAAFFATRRRQAQPMVALAA